MGQIPRSIERISSLLTYRCVDMSTDIRRELMEQKERWRAGRCRGARFHQGSAVHRLCTTVWCGVVHVRRWDIN